MGDFVTFANLLGASGHCFVYFVGLKRLSEVVGSLSRMVSCLFARSFVCFCLFVLVFYVAKIARPVRSSLDETIAFDVERQVGTAWLIAWVGMPIG